MTMKYATSVLLTLLFARSATPFSNNNHLKTTEINRFAAVYASPTDRTESEKGTRLEFKGDIEVVSDPLPSLPDDEMTAFFETPESRNLLATAGGKRSCEEISPTDDLLEEWKIACDIVGGQYPDESDSVLSVTTGGIDFPGLHVVSKANIGVKFIQEPSPRYEFVLIGDERTVKGLPPVKWIFKKLTGSGGDESSSTSTKSLSIVSYDRTDDGKTTTITTKSSISIELSFPTVLLKILPTSKEKTEKTGGKAISSTVEKDVQEAMKAFQEEYMKVLAAAETSSAE